MFVVCVFAGILKSWSWGWRTCGRKGPGYVGFQDLRENWQRWEVMWWWHLYKQLHTNNLLNTLLSWDLMIHLLCHYVTHKFLLFMVGKTDEIFFGSGWNTGDRFYDKGSTLTLRRPTKRAMDWIWSLAVKDTNISYYFQSLYIDHPLKAPNAPKR